MYADEYLLDIKSDIKADYLVVEKPGTREQPTLGVKRVRAGATNYSRRMFDCEARTAKILGPSKKLDDLANDSRDEIMDSVKEGIITYQL